MPVWKRYWKWVAVMLLCLTAWGQWQSKQLLKNRESSFSPAAAIKNSGAESGGEKTGDAEAKYAEGAADQKFLALTFDDGPHPVYTEELLDGLKERNVKATFFLIGKSARENPELVKRISEEGHLIGNHTMNHVQLNRQPYEEALAEIRQANDVIRELTGEEPHYIRPPFGEWSEALANEVDMDAVLWDVDPLDWKAKNTDIVVKRIQKDSQEGDIILLHDVYGTSVEAALEIIDQFQAQGYEFVTVDEILLD